MNIADYSAVNILCNKYSHKTTILEDYSNLPRPYFTFALILSGSMSCISDSGSVQAEKGDILFIPYKMQYQLHWSSPNTSVCSLHFNFPSFSIPFGNRTFQLQTISDFSSLYDDFIYIYDNINSESSVLGVLSTFYKICSSLFPYLKYHEEQLPDIRIRKAVDYIHNNFRRNLTVEELAEICGFSVSHFHYLFKKEVGMTAIEYKNSICIKHAAFLLMDEKNFSIEEISTECGFQSSEYFRRVFKSVMGISPREYRKKMSKRL